MVKGRCQCCSCHMKHVMVIRPCKTALALDSWNVTEPRPSAWRPLPPLLAWPLTCTPGITCILSLLCQATTCTSRSSLSDTTQVPYYITVAVTTVRILSSPLMCHCRQRHFFNTTSPNFVSPQSCYCLAGPISHILPRTGRECSIDLVQ